MVSRHRRRRKQVAFRPLPYCSNCGGRGSHFVPPSLGEPGFWLCLGLPSPSEPINPCPSIERFADGLVRQLVEAWGVPLHVIRGHS